MQKAVRSSELEGSIGGNVDLRTARPLDRTGFHASAAVEGQYNDLADKGGYKVSGVVSTTFADDTMGLMVGVSYNKYKFRTENLGEYSITDGTEAGYGVDFNGDGQINPDENGPAYIWPDYYSVGYVTGQRERIGAAGSFQWKPSSDFELTIDGLYSRFNVKQHNYRSSNYLNPLGDDGSLRWDPASIRTDANNVVTGFSLNDMVAEVLTTDEPRKSQTYQFGGHIDWKPADRFKLSFDGYYGKARDTTGGEIASSSRALPAPRPLLPRATAGFPISTSPSPGARPVRGDQRRFPGALYRHPWSKYHRSHARHESRRRV